jgi:hypothetical protein
MHQDKAFLARCFYRVCLAPHKNRLSPSDSGNDGRRINIIIQNDTLEYHDKRKYQLLFIIYKSLHLA